MIRLIGSFVAWCGLCAALLAQEEEAVKVYRDVQGCVVSLVNAEGSGTGIVLDKTGLILTNAHVVASPLPFRCTAEVLQGAKAETVTFTSVKVSGFHPQRDLALVRVDPKEFAGSLQPARLGKKKGTPGQRVYAIGNPGAGKVALTKTITAGILSGVDRLLEGSSYYQVDAPINPGNSGGPLVDKNGEVMGLVTLKITEGENLGFAIPLQEFKAEEFLPLSKLRGDPAKARELLVAAGRYSDQGRALAQARGVTDEGALTCNYLAAQCYHMALKYDPGNHAIYYNVGMLLRTLNDNEVGAAYLWEAIRLNPWGHAQGDYYRELGFALVKQKKRQEAHTAWMEGVAKYPRAGAKIWEDLAIFAAEEKDTYQAAYYASLVLHLKDAGTRLELMQQLANEQTGKLDNAGQRKLQAATGEFEAMLAERQRQATLAQQSGTRAMNADFTKLMARAARGEESSQPEKIVASEPVPAAKPEGPTPVSAPATKPAPEGPTRPPLDLAIPAGSRDLLADIVLKQHVVKGAWKFEGRALVSPLAPGALVLVPSELPAEYDLTCLVERKGNQKEFVLGFVREGTQSAFVVDAGGNTSGLDVEAREVHRGQILVVNRPVALVLKVRREGVLVTADGQKIFFEKSAGALPAVPAEWRPPAEDKLFLGANTSRFVVHKLMLTPYERKK